MFAVASNLASTLLAKPTSLSSYTLHSAGPSPAASPAIGSSSNGTSSAAQTSKGFTVGLWRVVGATHKTTNKDVSVWMFDKRVLDGIKSDSSGRPAAQAREWVVEQLKKEASSLTKLRHPDILHMVEPLEETRSELTFVTEYVTSSLYTTLHRSSANDGRHSRNRPPGTSSSASDARGEVDLDEVEIQKGVLQIARGLGFLHGPAKSVHRNLTPQAILINAKGDWKLSGLGLTTPLQKPDGSPTRYEYPEIDHRLPGEIQWKLDYLAPEYALDSQLSTSNDLYSLGCVLYALHMGGKPPYTNSGSMQSLRDHAEGLGRRDWASGPRWERCSAELKDLLPRLLTRQPSSRLSLASLPSHPFFSSLAISTLNFLDPTTFASKPREEKATYLRGLVRVLPSFSDRLRRTKILPSLLEEMKDSYLLPFILPNVFEISKTLSKEEFTVVLPKLQPLFALKDPPQNMLTLLENLTLFEEKTIPAIFRENVMPLIYNSIECEHLPVQEKVLKLVPHLCEILDYGTVHNILLVKVAMLFTRTRVLSVKVLTLETFRNMVTTLDKTTLTTKLVPLLAKIKTKEPAVMMATLGVHEAMGAKVDREAIATLVLPQLWSMSMGPLLNATQFDRFMAVIRSLGDRVAKEHGEHLKDVRRLEESQNARVAEMGLNGWDQAATGSGGAGEVDFEALVKGSSGPKQPANDGWGEGWDADDGLSEMFGTAMATTSAPAVQSRLANIPALGPDSGRPNTAMGSANRLKARPIPSTSFNASAFDTPAALPKPPTMNGLNTNGNMAGSSFAPLQPTQSSFAPMQPTSRAPSISSRPPASSAPNYNLSLSPQPPAISVSAFAPLQQPTYNQRPPQPQMAQPIAPAIKPPPGYSSGLMQPSKPAAPAWGSNPQGNGDWGDFDPFK